MGGRGFPRRHKAGLAKAPPKDARDRVESLLARALDYLDAELNMLVQMPGNYNGVIRIAGELNKLRKELGQADAGSPTNREVRSGFALDLDDPVQEG